jgi:hypothetical protein
MELAKQAKKGGFVAEKRPLDVVQLSKLIEMVMFLNRMVIIIHLIMLLNKV